YMATASWDGTIVIWEIKNNWKDSNPLLLSLKRENTSAHCVVFDKSNQQVLAGYKHGQIWKWPVNMDMLSGLICKNVNTCLDTSTWAKYIKGNPPIKEIAHYNC